MIHFSSVYISFSPHALLSLLSSHLSPPLSSLPVPSSLLHLCTHVTYQHEWVREYNPIELDDVLMV